MANVAALYLLNRNGAFKGLFSFDSSEGSVVRPDRYHKANINDEVLESYLAGSCKIKVSGMSDISNVFGQVARTNFKKLPDYKQYAQKQLEMIEPPSFLEKMMVINKSVAHTKLGKVAGKATLGAVPVAMTMVALSARAYGATRHFVMDKLNLHQTNQKSFSERLSEIKNRVGYKSDLKKIQNMENLQKTNSILYQKYWQAGTVADKNKEFSKLQKISSSNPLLENYMEGLALIDSNGKGKLLQSRYISTDQNGNKTTYRNWDAQRKVDQMPALQSKDLSNDIVRHMKAVEMIDPPTKTELKLIKNINRFEQLSERKSVDSPILAIIHKSLEKTMKHYIAEKEKQDPSFGAEKGLLGRLKDIQKRNDAQDRLNKLRTLEKKLKNNGR